MGAHGFVVGRRKDGDLIIRSDGPVGLFDFHPVLLCDFGTRIGSLDGLFDAPYAMVSPVDQNHVCGHVVSSFSCFGASLAVGTFIHCDGAMRRSPAHPSNVVSWLLVGSY